MSELTRTSSVSAVYRIGLRFLPHDKITDTVLDLDMKRLISEFDPGQGM